MEGERRRYPRVKLAVEDGFFGNFKLSDGAVINAPLVNLSVGGVNFAVRSSEKQALEVGYKLVMAKIFGATNFEMEGRVEVEVRWIGDRQSDGRIPVGCEFQDLDESQRIKIQDFVNQERVARGQYD